MVYSVDQSVLDTAETACTVTTPQDNVTLAVEMDGLEYTVPYVIILLHNYLLSFMLGTKLQIIHARSILVYLMGNEPF
jgi:hypothetical protein